MKEIQKLGFTFSEVDKLLNMRFEDGVKTGQVKQFFEDKMDEINEKLVHLETVKAVLRKASSRCEGGNRPVGECAILNFIDKKILN